MTYVMGIDGGGSTVRVVIVLPDLTICGQSEGTTVNPSLIGLEKALQTIQAAMQDALNDAGLSSNQLDAVGIGVAGADATHSEEWLREVVNGVAPRTQVAASADHEIALVGAHGERRGLLVLAGTGSLVCGANSAGKYVRVGGRGYLLGDEGSGYWIGMEGLKAAVRGEDGRSPRTTLTDALLDALQLQSVEELIPWLYRSGQSRTREIAALSSIILEQLQAGDAVAEDIVMRAANELALAVRAINYRLDMEELPVAFAGGLLLEVNPLSSKLCELLGLENIPTSKYSGTLGAAILAQQLVGDNL